MDWKREEVRDEDGNGFVVLKKDDLVMPPIFHKADVRLKMIKELPYSKDDIMICAYPKTGSHWVFNLVHFLITDGLLDELLSVPPMLMEHAPPPEKWDMVAKSALRSSHLKPDRLPTDLLKNGGKIILVVRNPKDVCVSDYHHLANMKSDMVLGGRMSWPFFVEAFVGGELFYGSYFDYYNAWEKEMAGNKNLDILVVHFEKLKTDGLKEMQRIQKFLRLNHPDEQLQKILDKCTVQKMRAEVKSGKTSATLVNLKDTSFIYRKGEVGDWKNYLTVAQSEYLDKVTAERLKDSVFVS